jgi:hypothetical protein
LGSDVATEPVGLDAAGLAVDHLGAAVQDLHAMALQQRADATGQPADDAVLPFDGARKIDRWPLDLDAERRRVRLLDSVMKGVSGVDERLGGNAADVEAGAAEPVAAAVLVSVLAALLGQHDVEPELAGADRRDVAAGPAAHHQDLGIDVGHRYASMKIVAGASSRPLMRCTNWAAL